MTITDAVKAAQRSTLMRFKTGAAIYDKHWHLLSVGWSHVPSRPLITTPFSKHAELHAVEQCDCLEYLDYAEHIVVVTMTRRGHITCGKPCGVCTVLCAKYHLQPHYTDWLVQPRACADTTLTLPPVQ